MSGYKSALIGAGVVALIVGGLFGTGAIKIGGSKADDAGDEAADADADGDEGKADAKKHKKGRHKKGRKKGRKKKGNLQGLAYLGEIPLTDETRDKVGLQTKADGHYDGMFIANVAGGGNTGRRNRRRGKAKSTRIREAGLWDADGKELHRWESDVPSPRRTWAITRLDTQGYLYTVVADTAFLKLDWDSNVVWLVNGRFHHDFTATPDGGHAVLSEHSIIAELPEDLRTEGSTGVRILDHGVTFIGSDGDVTDQVWMYESFKDHPALLRRLRRGVEAKGEKVVVEEGDAEREGGLDVFHANSVVVLPRDIEGLGKTGDLLLSFRHLNTVASVSRSSGEVLWSWGSDELIRQHDATLTADGQVILFDNRTHASGSRAVIVDPKTNEITRTIGGPDATGSLRFFSMGRGIVQALPNENVFVVASNEGRAFEVTPDGRVTWEFWSPWIVGDARLPIRAQRLEGELQTVIGKIVSGEMEPPRVETPGTYKQVTAPMNAVIETDEAEEAGPGDDAPEGDAPEGDVPTPAKEPTPEGDAPAKEPSSDGDAAKGPAGNGDAAPAKEPAPAG